MLKKLNKRDSKGRELYENALTGKQGPLCQQIFKPSLRREFRQPEHKVSSTKISKYTSANKKNGIGYRTGRFIQRILKVK